MCSHMNRTCYVCLEALGDDENGGALHTTACGHVTHRMCIDSWIATNLTNDQTPSCPLCRVVIDVSPPPHRAKRARSNAIASPFATPRIRIDVENGVRRLVLYTQAPPTTARVEVWRASCPEEPFTISFAAANADERAEASEYKLLDPDDAAVTWTVPIPAHATPSALSLMMLSRLGFPRGADDIMRGDASATREESRDLYERVVHMMRC